jgi:hypothetical protein
MTLVRIVKNWEWPDIMRQTPGSNGVWDGVRFTLEPVAECDYLIVLNRPAQDITVRCPPQHVWAVVQEPPNECFQPMHRGDISYAQVYTSDAALVGRRYRHSHPALPWHVNRDYDFLSRCKVPEKKAGLSWITSDITVFQGHRDRLSFLERIRDDLEFDLFGKGFSFIKDKWDGLAPYRYSIVVENFSNPWYWSEKLADCFLAWTMPIYYGCTRISDFFPEESVVAMDINDPMAPRKIQEVIASDLWRRRLDVIDYSRRLVLDNYQLFPFLVRAMRAHQHGVCSKRHRPRTVTVPRVLRPPASVSEKLRDVSRDVVPQFARRVMGWLRHRKRGI